LSELGSTFRLGWVKRLCASELNKKSVACTLSVTQSGQKVTVFGPKMAKLVKKLSQGSTFGKIKNLPNFQGTLRYVELKICRSTGAIGAKLTAPAHFLCLKIALGSMLGSIVPILGRAKGSFVGVGGSTFRLGWVKRMCESELNKNPLHALCPLRNLAKK